MDSFNPFGPPMYFTNVAQRYMGNKWIMKSLNDSAHGGYKLEGVNNIASWELSGVKLVFNEFLYRIHPTKRRSQYENVGV